MILIRLTSLREFCLNLLLEWTEIHTHVRCFFAIFTSSLNSILFTLKTNIEISTYVDNFKLVAIFLRTAVECLRCNDLKTLEIIYQKTRIICIENQSINLRKASQEVMDTMIRYYFNSESNSMFNSFNLQK